MAAFCQICRHRSRFWRRGAIGLVCGVAALAVPAPALAESESGGPAVSGFTQSSARWRAGTALAQTSTSSQPPVGTVFSFSLNEEASVTLSFVQVLAGRKAGGFCVRETAKNRHKPGCKLTAPAGPLTFNAHAGANTVRFDGRITASKALKPGPCMVGIRAVNAQKRHSAPKLLSFTIVK